MDCRSDDHNARSPRQGATRPVQTKTGFGGPGHCGIGCGSAGPLDGGGVALFRAKRFRADGNSACRDRGRARGNLRVVADDQNADCRTRAFLPSDSRFQRHRLQKSAIGKNPALAGNRRDPLVPRRFGRHGPHAGAALATAASRHAVGDHARGRGDRALPGRHHVESRHAADPMAPRARANGHRHADALQAAGSSDNRRAATWSIRTARPRSGRAPTTPARRSVPSSPGIRRCGPSRPWLSARPPRGR
jgi:hypothetical protein